MNDPHERIEVRVRRLDHAGDLPLPAPASSEAAGADIRAAVDEPVTIAVGAVVRVPTGIAIELPPGFEMQVRPRSGLAMKHGVTVVNSPATIDSDYRGEILIGLINHGPAPFTVERGMRIAQMLLARVPRIEWVEVDALSATPRGSGGFGHTGSR